MLIILNGLLYFATMGNIDDSTFYKSVARGGFRLHPGQVSEGCITLPSQSDYNRLRNALLRTKTAKVKGLDLIMEQFHEASNT